MEKYRRHQEIQKNQEFQELQEIIVHSKKCSTRNSYYPLLIPIHKSYKAKSWNCLKASGTDSTIDIQELQELQETIVCSIKCSTRNSYYPLHIPIHKSCKAKSWNCLKASGTDSTIDIDLNLILGTSRNLMTIQLIFPFAIQKYL